MSTLYIYRGVPASGKSTHARKWVAESAESRTRVNRDDLRFMRYNKGWGVDEARITRDQDLLVKDSLEQGLDVALDNTNLKSSDVRHSIKIALSVGASLEYVDFPIDYRTAVARDKMRQAMGERFVGEAVIKSFFDRYIRKGNLPPRPEVDNDMSMEFQPYVYNPELLSCIIVDVDGTLADMGDARGPYDTSRYHLDQIVVPVRDIVAGHAQLSYSYVIIMSGRSEEFRPVTVQWLKDNNVGYDFLYMRGAGDKRKDTVVKNELFETHIAGEWNVDWVMDDRPSVCRMWRAKGLKVLQVGDPHVEF